MPMTVITLTKVPKALRGDLTKWLQEISTGVYVGNINSRIREQLWERVINNVQNGQATMSYSKQNEIGYNFVVYNTSREVVNYDGIPLVFLPVQQKEELPVKLGYSNAAKYEKIKRTRIKTKSINFQEKEKNECNYVVIDTETTGTNLETDKIIEIAAIKKEKKDIIVFKKLIKIDTILPEEIRNLTGITDDLLTTEGENISIVLDDLIKFIGNLTIVGYNVQFDINFLNKELERHGKSKFKNKTVCILSEVKKRQKLLRNYKLATVLEKYSINADGLHRAYIDAVAIHTLAIKLNIL